MGDPVARPTTLLGVGDIHIERASPHDIFRHVRDVLLQGDVVFANSEQMHSDQGQPNPLQAAFSHPRNIPALVDAGIDVVSLANNHTMDWGAAGLLDTIDRLDRAGIASVGAGANIAAARAPVVLERDGTSFGFLAYCCVGPEGYEAETDAPGFAPVRVWTIYERVDYQPATPPRIVSLARQDDLRRMEADIAALRERCDVVVISFHWGLHFVPRTIPEYCVEVGRAAVDAGADLVLGCHPHMLKGAEIYRDRAIFYSTGCFAVELGAGPEAYHGTGRVLTRFTEHYGFTPDPDYPTLPFHPDAKMTLIVKATVSDRRIAQVSYVPCFITPSAEPVVVDRSDPRGVQVFDYMRSISDSEGLHGTYRWQADGREVLLEPGP